MDMGKDIYDKNGVIPLEERLTPKYEPSDFRSSDPRFAGSCRSCFEQGLHKPCMESRGLPDDSKYLGDIPCEECDKLETKEERELCKKYNCGKVEQK